MINVYFKYTQRYKKMIAEELKNFVFENLYKRIRFAKENNYYTMKHQKKKDLLLLRIKLTKNIPGGSNPKEYYKSFLKNKNKKMVKRSKLITQQQRTIRKPRYY